MCGRFAMFDGWSEIYDLLGGRGIENARLPPRYNIAPTTRIPILRAVPGGGGPNERVWEGALATWGLKPDWSRTLLINATGEKLTAPGRSFWKSGWQRCLIPASGFYEWLRLDGRKLPHFIHNADGRPLLLAGLARTWASPGEEPDEVAVIVTTGPNALMRRIHDRMPAIVKPEDAWTWLEGPPAPALALIAPDDGLPLEAYEVDAAVNSVRNDGPALARRLED